MGEYLLDENQTIESLLWDNLIDFELVEDELTLYRAKFPESPLVLLADANRHGLQGNFREAYGLVQKVDCLSSPQYFLAAVNALYSAFQLGYDTDLIAFEQFLSKGLFFYSENHDVVVALNEVLTDESFSASLTDTVVALNELTELTEYLC